MTTEIINREISTISQAQAELARLAAEETSLPAQREAKDYELAGARARGDFQQAAILEAEISDLRGPRLERIQEARAYEQCALWEALAEELEKQASELEHRSQAQLALEDKAREHLEEVSGCNWGPKQTRIEAQGLSRVVTDRPLSEVWQAQADYRKQLASRLRVPNPDQFQNITREALCLVFSPES